MALFTTDFGSFDVVKDDMNGGRTKVIDPISKKPLAVLTGVDWWDKDGIEKSLYESKETIVSKMEQWKEVLPNGQASMTALEFIINSLPSHDDREYCLTHLKQVKDKLSINGYEI